jgi:hypothetical protein
LAPGKMTVPKNIAFSDVHHHSQSATMDWPHEHPSRFQAI